MDTFFIVFIDCNKNYSGVAKNRFSITMIHRCFQIQNKPLRFVNFDFRDKIL